MFNEVYGMKLHHFYMQYRKHCVLSFSILWYMQVKHIWTVFSHIQHHGSGCQGKQITSLPDCSHHWCHLPAWCSPSVTTCSKYQSSSIFICSLHQCGICHCVYGKGRKFWHSSVCSADYCCGCCFWPILFSEIGFCVASCSYIYIYILAEAARLRRASSAIASRKRKRNMHDGIPMMELPQ